MPSQSEMLIRGDSFTHRQALWMKQDRNIQRRFENCHSLCHENSRPKDTCLLSPEHQFIVGYKSAFLIWVLLFQAICKNISLPDLHAHERWLSYHGSGWDSYQGHKYQLFRILHHRKKTRISTDLYLSQHAVSCLSISGWPERPEVGSR